MLVSVFMPAYNSEKYIEKAIESILEQTWQDFEFVIVNDGSTDRTGEIIAGYRDLRIRSYSNEVNQGVVFTRNRGLQLCRNPYMALMDADDIAPRNRLEKEVLFLENNPEIDCVTGRVEFINQFGDVISKKHSPLLNPDYLKAYMLFNNAVANGSVMFRKKVVDENNLCYKTSGYKIDIEDYRFWCDFLQFGTIAGIDELLQYYRDYTGGLTYSANAAERGKVLDLIHEESFRYFGIELPPIEKQVVLKLFRENGTIDRKEEIAILYNALKTILQQAGEKMPEIKEEIKTVCRKQFAEKLNKAYCLWN